MSSYPTSKLFWQIVASIACYAVLLYLCNVLSSRYFFLLSLERVLVTVIFVCAVLSFVYVYKDARRSDEFEAMKMACLDEYGDLVCESSQDEKDHRVVVLGFKNEQVVLFQHKRKKLYEVIGCVIFEHILDDGGEVIKKEEIDLSETFWNQMIDTVTISPSKIIAGSTKLALNPVMQNITYKYSIVLHIRDSNNISRSRPAFSDMRLRKNSTILKMVISGAANRVSEIEFHAITK